ncbi:MAG TPA: DNA methyltransferase, partial [Solirubrobacteraceae bacterium]|nr:DNA methyltransferase [Solirubrobacteraceae bacterium]
MRVVFLLAAEARGLMPEDGPWVESYAVAPIREQLRTVSDRDGEELLDRRFDAWPQLLATFRAVHGGVEHPRIRLPGYGGGLFDPERYPFLEGTDDARLRISNRVMLHFLDALQTLEVEVPGGRERRPLSFRALGVEQIGHVYEGLLDHEAVRTFEPAMGLAGTSKKEPEIALSLLEQARGQGDSALLKLLKDETGRSASALRRSLESDPDAARVVRLRAACDNDVQLVERMLPYLALVRDNTFGSPTVYLPETVYVTASTRRRSTGTHYTPPSLTEPIVRYALEPVVYHGPAEGLQREEWTLKPPTELLALKVCDIAMGSGAFLVAACRYLAARLMEAWDNYPGELPDDAGSDPEERELTARRLVAERCLYGVDKNSLAVDIAKVSLWLITLRRDRPFTFVDHALRDGDSLLGLVSERQLQSLSLSPDDSRPGWMLDVPRQIVHDVLVRVRDLRERIEASDAIDLRDVEQKLVLLSEAERAQKSLQGVADLVAGATLAGAPSRDPDASRALVEERAAEIAIALRDEGKLDDEIALTGVSERASQYLDAGRVAMQPAPQPFHWVLEFPEVFARDDAGFDAIVGNPPFLGGKKVSGELGSTYREYLTEEVADGRRGNADLVAFFFLRAAGLTCDGGTLGLVATNTVAQGDTREVGLGALVDEGWKIFRATDTVAWPGEAALYVSYVWSCRRGWKNDVLLQDTLVQGITSSLDAASRVAGPAYKLVANRRAAQQGSNIVGDAFFLSENDVQGLRESDSDSSSVVKRCLNAAELTDLP